MAKASNFVDQDRLWSRLAEMATLGGTPKGGVNRQALTPLDGKARRKLADWARARGFKVYEDAIGNLFVRREGKNPDLPPVTTGSHLDTQPTGGRFDGAYGVMAGFEVLEALEDGEIETLHPVECVAWTNEEGARFPPTAMGSAVYAGKIPVDRLMGITDPDGVKLSDALAAVRAETGPCEERALGAPISAYVEAHIEQGPILEAAAEVVGVVTSIQSQMCFQVTVLGVEAHAGTTPRKNRSDAMLAAVEIISEIEKAALDDVDLMRFTVGRMIVSPGAPNTVPSNVHFTIDLRHPDDAAIRKVIDRIMELVETVPAKRNCTADIVQTSNVAVTPFDPGIIDAVDDARLDLGFAGRRMPSGAGHDAMYIAPLAPTGMIFVPCVGGISHNEAEDALPEDLAAGAKVLADTLAKLAEV